MNFLFRPFFDFEAKLRSKKRLQKRSFWARPKSEAFGLGPSEAKHQKRSFWRSEARPKQAEIDDFRNGRRHFGLQKRSFWDQNEGRGRPQKRSFWPKPSIKSEAFGEGLGEAERSEASKAKLLAKRSEARAGRRPKRAEIGLNIDVVGRRNTKIWQHFCIITTYEHKVIPKSSKTGRNMVAHQE